ncbi:iron permease FTR1 family-domain-containing protein [Chytriomyces sp. MP71]|nr:iron permease FTR1 family-domain-containing protein [Chytriomyces sp. MP71]
MAIGFSVPVFFVVLRECTEASIVMSVMFTFIHSMFATDSVMRGKLSRSLWAGTLAGVMISLAIGTAFLVIWFKYASNLWASTEALWEAIFQLIAAFLLAGMALAFLKSDALMDKWNRKLGKALKDHKVAKAPKFASDSTLRTDSVDEIQVFRAFPSPDAASSTSASVPTTSSDSQPVDASPDQTTVGSGTQAFFWIPFVTILREGLEGMVFLGGIALSDDAGHIPLAVLAGLAVGIAIGYAIYRAGNTLKLHTFFVCATVLILYLAAGLFSKSVWSFELNNWTHALGATDPDELGNYNVKTNVWHLSCCDPNNRSAGGWQLLNAVFGWTNSPTVGSIVSYILFWLLMSLTLVVMKLMDRRRVRLGLEKCSSFFVDLCVQQYLVRLRKLQLTFNFLKTIRNIRSWNLHEKGSE